MYELNHSTVQLRCPIEQFSDNFAPSKTFDGAMCGNNSRALYFFSNKPNIIIVFGFSGVCPHSAGFILRAVRKLSTDALSAVRGLFAFECPTILVSAFFCFFRPRSTSTARTLCCRADSIFSATSKEIFSGRQAAELVNRLSIGEQNLTHSLEQTLSLG